MIEKLAPTLDAMTAGDMPSPAGSAPADGAIDFSALLGLAAVVVEDMPAAGSPVASAAGPLSDAHPAEVAAITSPPMALSGTGLDTQMSTAPVGTMAEPTPGDFSTKTVKPLTSQSEGSPLDLMSRIAAWLAPKASAEQKPADESASGADETGDDSVSADQALMAQPNLATIQPLPVAASLAPVTAGKSPSAAVAAEVRPTPDMQAAPEIWARPEMVQARDEELPTWSFVAPDAKAEAGVAGSDAATDIETFAPEPMARRDAAPQPLGLIGAPASIVETSLPEMAGSVPTESLALEDLLIADAADGAWLDRLAGDIRMLADGEHREAHLKLTPRMLGDMDIRLDLDGRHARVHFTVETVAAQALIADGAGRLATLVEANGLKLDGATVDLGQGRRDEREAAAERGEHFQTQGRSPRPAPELVRAVARTRIATGYERYA